MTQVARWWVLQHPDEAQPAAVFAEGDDGLPRRFVPGQGLVDWPSLAEYTIGGEPGAHVVDAKAALRHIRNGVGRVSPDVVARNRGSAPTLPVPKLG